jgi:hypothetical protein
MAQPMAANPRQNILKRVASASQSKNFNPLFPGFNRISTPANFSHNPSFVMLKRLVRLPLAPLTQLSPADLSPAE